MLPPDHDLAACAPVRHRLRLRPMPGRLSPKGTAKQSLFELSQFVLPRKMYVTRHAGGLIYNNDRNSKSQTKKQSLKRRRRLRYALNRFGICNLFVISCLEFVILVKYPGQMHVILLRRSNSVFLLETD